MSSYWLAMTLCHMFAKSGGLNLLNIGPWIIDYVEC